MQSDACLSLRSRYVQRPIIQCRKYVFLHCQRSSGHYTKLENTCIILCTRVQDSDSEHLFFIIRVTFPQENLTMRCPSSKVCIECPISDLDYVIKQYGSERNLYESSESRKIREMMLFINTILFGKKKKY